MTRLAMVCAFLLLVVSAPAQIASNPANEPESRYTLSGTVVNAVTGEPVQRALVQVFLGAEQSMLTDGSGHFEFEGLPAGQTSVTVRKPGFFSEQELERGQYEQPLVQVGANAQPVTLKLVPEGVIAGHIESRDGEALENLPVRLIRFHVANGRRQWDQAGTTNTDDDGQFRVGNLMPGWYYVVAGPSAESQWRGAAGSKGRETTFPEVFYPGVRELATATPIEVAAGQQAQADLSLTAEPVFKVSGTVEAEENQGTNIEFLTLSGETLSVPVEYGEGRSFEAKVPAGSYMLKSNVFGEGTQLSGTMSLTVSSDMKGVRVPVGPAMMAPVRITFERARQNQSGRAVIFERGNSQSVNLHLVREGASFGGGEEWLSIGTSPDPVANSIHDLAPGRYSVDIVPSSPEWYVRSAQCGGVDLLRDALIVVPGARLSPLEIVLRNDGAQLTGMARTSVRPVHAAVIAVPDSAPRSAKMVPAAPDGSFSLSGLAPGDYSILAVDRADGLEYANPEALTPYLSSATRVSLVPSGQANVEVNVVELGK